jgi:hypothetical protein
MKQILLALGASSVIAGCSVNGSAPMTAWGKKDVTMLDYRTDAGECSLLGATFDPGLNGAKTAGGLSGQNGSPPPMQQASGTANAAAGKPGGNGGGGTVTDGTVYRDSASSDFVNRAATQQRDQELATQRARTEALKSCLVGRGYTEFSLSPEQRAQLAKLPPGSAARREFLYKLGTDPAVLTGQSLKR